MNKEQQEILLHEINRFENIATTEEFRKTEEYNKLSIRLVEEELKEYSQAKELPDLLDAIGDCYVVIIKAVLNENIPITIRLDYNFKLGAMLGSIELLGICAFAVVYQVCYSNMTKFPTIEDVKVQYGEQWREPACSWIEEHRGKEGVYATIVEEEPDMVSRVVFKDKTHKVCKPWCFLEPSFDNIQ